MDSYSPYMLERQLAKKKERDQRAINLETWDPMKEDFMDPDFNQYTRGPARNMPAPEHVQSENGRPEFTLYVTGIPNRITEDGMRGMFEEHGRVLTCRKMVSKRPELKSTFGFVSYGTQREALSAITALNNKKFLNGEINMRVTFALTPEQKEAKRREAEYNAALMKGVGDPTGDSGSQSDDELTPADISSGGNLKVLKQRGENETEDRRVVMLDSKSNGASSGYNSDAASSGGHLGSSPGTAPTSTSTENISQPSNTSSVSPTPSTSTLAAPVGTPAASVGTSGQSTSVSPSATLATASQPMAHSRVRTSAAQLQDTAVVAAGPSIKPLMSKGPLGSYRFPAPQQQQQPYRQPYQAQQPRKRIQLPGYTQQPRYPGIPGQNISGMQNYAQYGAPRQQFPNVMPTQPKTCALCGSPATQQCSRCHLTSYCSKPCQVNHWPEHQPNCTPPPPLSPIRQPGSNYKTKECLYHRLSGCSKGDNCTFLHMQENLGADKANYQTRECTFYRLGKCSKGDSCPFIHIEANHGVNKAEKNLKGCPGECFYWRTSGCRDLAACKREHRPDSKGIDDMEFRQYLAKVASTAMDKAAKVVATPDVASIDQPTAIPVSQTTTPAQAIISPAAHPAGTNAHPTATSQAPVASIPRSTQPTKPVEKEPNHVSAAGDAPGIKQKVVEPVHKTTPGNVHGGSGDAGHHNQKVIGPKEKVISPPRCTVKCNTQTINTRPEENFEDRYEVDINEDLLERLIEENFGASTQGKSQTEENKRSGTDSHQENQDIPQQSTKVSSRPSSTDPRPSSRSSGGKNAPRVKTPRMRLAREFSKENLSVGLAVQVSEAAGVNDFWLVKAARVSEVERLVQQLTSVCEGQSKPYTPDRHEMVAARFSDNQWYRACVLNIRSDRSCDVHFVDYGNLSPRDEPVSAEHVKHLPDIFCKLPIQAVQCELGLAPQSALGEWTQEAKVEIAHKLTPFANAFILTQISDAEGKHRVELRLEGASNDVTEKLVRLKMAVRLHQDPSKTQNTQQSRSRDQQHRKAADSKSPVQTQPHASPKLATNAKTSPGAAKPSAAGSEEEIQPAAMKSLGELPLPTQAKYSMNPGDQPKVLVLAVASPHLFWVHVPCLELTQELPTLQKRMQTHYGAKKPSASFKPNGKDLYAVKSVRDGEFRRGFVYAEEMRHVSVLYLDTAQRERVPFSHVFNLDSPFCSLPLQAVPCSVADISPPGGASDWTAEQCEQFTGLILNNKYKAVVAARDATRVHVDLIEARGDSLRLYMIQHGIASSNKSGTTRNADSNSMKVSEPSSRSQRQTPQMPAASQAPATSAHKSVAPSGDTAQIQRGPQSAFRSPPSNQRTAQAQRSPAKPVTLPASGSEVIVCVAESPAQFYIHTPEQQEQVARLCVEVHTACSKSAPLTNQQSPGTMLAADFEGIFCRARVVRSLPGYQYELFYVDYGNTAMANAVDMRVLPTQFQQLPTMATECALDGVIGTGVGDAYTEQACRWFKEKVEEQPGIRIQHSGDAHAVQLILSGGQEVSQLLVQEGFARTAGPPPVLMRDHKKRELPQTCDVTCTEVTDDLHLYLQILTDADVLNSVVTATEEYGASTPYDPSFNPTAGHMCTSLYPEDRLWYRACVVGGPSPDKLTVLFVDFGNHDIVPKSSVRRYESSWQQYPLLAVRCRLEGVTCGGEAPRTAVQELQALTIGKRQQCTRVGTCADGSYSVRLTGGSDYQTSDINQAVQRLMF